MAFGLVNKQPEQSIELPTLKHVAQDDFPRAIYVAGASSEIDRAEGVMAYLRANGMLVVSTWVDTIRKVGAANPMTASREQRYIWSAVDLHEVSQAAFLLYLLPKAGVTTSGAWVELGYALALQAVVENMIASGAPVPANAQRTVLVAGEERSIFSALADHFDTDYEATAAILEATAAVRSKSR